MRGTRKDYQRPTRKTVEKVVARFLDAPQRKDARGRGGFAEVPEGDMDELSDLIRAFVKYRYAPDCDGDRPIKWDLCDWTKQTPHHYRYLPHDKDDGSNLDAVLEIALLNMSIAHGDVDRVHRMSRYFMQQRKENNDQKEVTRGKYRDVLQGLVDLFPVRPVDEGTGGIGWNPEVTAAYDKAVEVLKRLNGDTKPRSAQDS